MRKPVLERTPVVLLDSHLIKRLVWNQLMLSGNYEAELRMVQTGHSKGQLSDFYGATHQKEETVTTMGKQISWAAIPVVGPEGECLHGFRGLHTAVSLLLPPQQDHRAKHPTRHYSQALKPNRICLLGHRRAWDPSIFSCFPL